MDSLIFWIYRDFWRNFNWSSFYRMTCLIHVLHGLIVTCGFMLQIQWRNLSEFDNFQERIIKKMIPLLKIDNFFLKAPFLILCLNPVPVAQAVVWVVFTLAPGEVVPTRPCQMNCCVTLRFSSVHIYQYFIGHLVPGQVRSVRYGLIILAAVLNPVLPKSIVLSRHDMNKKCGMARLFKHVGLKGMVNIGAYRLVYARRAG